MKRKLFLLMTVAFSALASYSQEQQPLVIYAGDVKTLTISDNIDVVLLQDNETERGIKISPEAGDKLWTRITTDALQIGKLHTSKKDRLQVYVYVQKSLRNIIAEESSTVDTKGVLATRNLNVYVENDARVRVVTNAIVNGYALDNSAIDVKSTNLTSEMRKGL